MVAVSSQKLLMEELSEHNVFFDMVVDMIPSTVGKSGGEYGPNKSKYLEKVAHDNQRSEESTGEGLKEAQAGSFAKENDSRHKISPQEIRERWGNRSASLEEKIFESGQDSSANQRTTTGTTTTTPVDPNQSRHELQAKLHAKIAAKEGQRPSINSDQVSKRAGRRAEKERRRDEAVKRKEAGNTRTSDTSAGSLWIAGTAAICKDINSEVAAGICQKECLSILNHDLMARNQEDGKFGANLSKKLIDGRRGSTSIPYGSFEGRKQLLLDGKSNPEK
jgi:hypothetical protein